MNTCTCMYYQKIYKYLPFIYYFSIFPLKIESNMGLYIFYQKEEAQMNKWVKSLTAMALASSLLMVGCSKGEDKKKEDDTTTQQEDKKDKETSGTEKSTDSKEKK
jgi:hypothetical protein